MKLPKITFHHYKFKYSDQISVGVNITREAFRLHNSMSTTLSFDYGKGCFYVEVRHNVD